MSSLDQCPIYLVFDDGMLRGPIGKVMRLCVVCLPCPVDVPWAISIITECFTLCALNTQEGCDPSSDFQSMPVICVKL